jgi:hypothetical protein
MNGLALRFEARLEPPSPAGPDLGRGGVLVDSSIHRFLADGKSMTYVGYDIRLEDAGEQRVRVTFAPLSAGPSLLFGKNDAAGWTELPAPKFPEPQIVNTGDTIVFDLMVRPATGQRIVERLTIDGRAALVPHTVSNSPRDFRARDAWLRLTSPTLFVDNAIVDHASGGISGPAVAFYLKGHGRFILTMVPPAGPIGAGFVRAGAVGPSNARFQWNGREYRIESYDIVDGPGPYNLYVHHDSSYVPKQPGLTFSYSASVPEALVRR